MITVRGSRALDSLGLADVGMVVRIFGLIALSEIARESGAVGEPDSAKHIAPINSYHAVCFGPNYPVDPDIQLCLLGDRWINDIDSIITRCLPGCQSFSGRCMNYLKTAEGQAIFQLDVLTRANDECLAYMQERDPLNEKHSNKRGITKAFPK